MGTELEQSKGMLQKWAFAISLSVTSLKGVSRIEAASRYGHDPKDGVVHGPLYAAGGNTREKGLFAGPAVRHI